MKDCQDCEVFKEWSGVKSKVHENTKYREQLTATQGTIDRIWTAIDQKVSRGFLILMTGIFLGFVGTLFTLVYYSNSEILAEFVNVKADIKVIKTTLKIPDQDL